MTARPEWAAEAAHKIAVLRSRARAWEAERDWIRAGDAWREAAGLLRYYEGRWEEEGWDPLPWWRWGQA